MFKILRATSVKIAVGFLVLLRLQNRFLKKLIERGNWTKLSIGVVPTAHLKLKINVSIRLEIWGVNITLSTLCQW